MQDANRHRNGPPDDEAKVLRALEVVGRRFFYLFCVRGLRKQSASRASPAKVIFVYNFDVVAAVVALDATLAV